MMQSEPRPARGSTPWLLLLGGALFACACCACITGIGAAVALGWIHLPGTSNTNLGDPPRTITAEQKPVEEAAGQFLQRWQSSNWVAAYQLCSPSLQREVRSATELGQRIAGMGSTLSAWRINRISSVNERDTTAEVRATGLFDGRAEPMLLQLERVGREWKIRGFRATP